MWSTTFNKFAEGTHCSCGFPVQLAVLANRLLCNCRTLVTPVCEVLATPRTRSCAAMTHKLDARSGLRHSLQRNQPKA